MQHPFEGILGAGHEQAAATRRSMLARMLAAMATLFGAGAVASAQSWIGFPTTLAYGEEGGTTTEAWEEGGGLTTRTAGEEGGHRPTHAWWEQGGRPPPWPGRPPTYALCEEGGRPHLPHPHHRPPGGRTRP
jgi:hypothetical protein